MIELLSPVGDFECLKAAVQNGASAVYFGANMFNARAFASNFDDENLKKAINYAKIRGVKTHLTLNICIKESEFEDAFNLAKKAYEFGIDAIIVQDFGLAKALITYFPDLEIHGSTQMTIHNLEGALFLEKLNFKRAVLSRELSLEEIKYICNNSNIEIEVFAHGALCISYSGQCLLSSMIGARSGNRGKCAQPCRLPYELLEQNKTSLNKLDSGYLLSTRDLCSLEHLPLLIEAGVKSLKIEGRMKSPEYVATVTRIYRKYIDLAYKYINKESSNYIIDPQDKLDLMQVFNRGGFSLGHLEKEENKNLIFKEKQNNMGLPIGRVSKINKNKGLISCKIENKLSIGDSICFENEPTKYTVSELMENNSNVKFALSSSIVTFGRMKGNINIGDKIFKIADKNLSAYALESFNKENIKVPIECNISIKKNEKIKIDAIVPTFNFKYSLAYDYIPEQAKSAPISIEKIKEQFSKTLNTCFAFSKLSIDLDDNLFIPVSTINDIRRTVLMDIENKIYKSFERTSENTLSKNVALSSTKTKPKISILLNILNLEFDYSKLKNINNIYVPLKYFANPTYREIIDDISSNFNLYIYMPTIIRKKYMNTVKNILSNLGKFNIKGIVISNLSNLQLLSKLNISNLDIIGNYTLNIYNSYTIKSFSKFNISTFTISPELDEASIIDICNNSCENKELIVYGNLPVMTMNYCPLGRSNKCYKDCAKKCISSNKYFLKDRLGMLFRILPDNTQTISTLYNSKTTSIKHSDFKISSVRIDILDESLDEINDIALKAFKDERFEGKNFTNGNLNRSI